MIDWTKPIEFKGQHPGNVKAGIKKPWVKVVGMARFHNPPVWVLETVAIKDYQHSDFGHKEGSTYLILRNENGTQFEHIGLRQEWADIQNVPTKPKEYWVAHYTDKFNTRLGDFEILYKIPPDVEYLNKSQNYHTVTVIKVVEQL